MAPTKKSIPPVVQPRFTTALDSFNSSSTGHQVVENNQGGSIGWRESRTRKLTTQLKGDIIGGMRVFDQVGAGSEDWHNKVKTVIPKHVMRRHEMSVEKMLVTGNSVTDVSSKQEPEGSTLHELKVTQESTSCLVRKKIFDGLVIYVNGSTHPLISDHKLKYLLAENGAKMSIHLGRRQVTHVILGKPCGARDTVGAGGGLAAIKIQKEIRTIGGCGVKYVGVEWVLESVKAGKRLTETRFSNLMLAHSGQKSVYSMLKKGKESN